VAYRAENLRPRDGGDVGTQFDLLHDERRQVVDLPLHGVYNVLNCLAAAACAAELGVGLEEIAAAVAAVRPLAGRGEVHRLPSGATVIDDSYNSNPAALSLALESARRLPASRRWAVLGDMLELGPEAEELHRAAGFEAAGLGFSPLHGVGPLSRFLVQGAAEAGAEAHWHADADAAAAALEGAAAAGEVILVKGSRGVGLERVVRALVAEGGRC
jgi:UDP-N-acetylmuramoyl-tripeptide--D-alanyl-D-alanine ligase